jgi:FkbM family methyltransferase
MRVSHLPGYCVRGIIRTVGPKWGSRLLVRMPKALIEFETIVSYRGIRFSLDTSEHLGRSIFYFHQYEPAQVAAFLELASGKTVFDIGANVGVFTTLAALNGARVFAFEPSRMVRAILEKNVALNGFTREVTIIPDAISDSERMMPFYETRSRNWGIGRVFPFGESQARPNDYEVHADTVDAFVRRFGRPDVIKIDIEGAEWFALNGAAATLSSPNAPQLFIEFHPKEITALGGTFESCLKALQEYGYHRYEIIGAHPGTHVWFCFSKLQLNIKLLRLCS